MKKLYIIFAAALAIVTGCANFDEMNTTSTALTKEQLPAGNVFARMVYKGIYSDQQRNWNLYDDMYASYFSDNTTWWSSLFGAYNDGWAGCLWWQHYDQYLQYDIIIKDICGDKAEYAKMRAISDVLNVYHWTRMTDRWGDVPYTGAGYGENVPYTPQAEIYADLLKRLDEDGQALAVTTPQYNPGSFDLIYEGDYAKWSKFAYSLMLRLATRVSKVDKTLATTYAQKAVNGGLMTSYEDVASIPCDASIWGDYYDRTSYDWYQTAPDADFVAVLNGTNAAYKTNVQDPRLPIFFIKADTGENAGEYVGFPRNPTKEQQEVAMKRGGDITTGSGYYFSTLNSFEKNGYFFHNFHSTSTPRSNLAYPVMTYSETLFCRAELVLRGILTGDAEALWKQGIEASIYEAYDHTKYLGDGVAALKSADITAYINALPAFGSSNEDKLRSIIIQKWIAVYPNATEAWNDIRRTGYPDIASGLISYAGTESKNANSLVTEGNTVQRIAYPDNAYNYDEDNIPAEYKNGGSCHAKRMQYGVWWSYAGKDKPYAANTRPSNF